MAENVRNDEVDDSESEYTDYEADNAVENSVFGFLDFGSVARRGHIGDATDNDDDYADKAKYADNSVENGNNIALQIVIVCFVDWFYYGDTKFCNYIFHF